MSTYSIKDLETLSGIKAHTLRIWEQRYNLLTPKRTDTNIRYYDDDDIKRILNISLLNQHGIKISNISKMSNIELSENVSNLGTTDLLYPENVNKLVICMLDLNENSFNNLMNENSQKWGFENTIINIIHPFLIKIGLLWQTGAISPAHEHFITNLIRQKIITEINNLECIQNQASKKFILYLPENEYHELGILFCHYLLKKRNQFVIYLGQNLPMVDVKSIYKSVNPDYIFTIMTSSLNDFTTEEYVNLLSSEFADTKILITGFQVLESKIKPFKNIQILYKFDEIVEYTR